jgi:hypothetical protein
VQKTVLVEEPQIVRAKPAVAGEGLPGRGLVVPVSREDVRPPHQDLALRFLPFPIHADLDAGHRHALRVEAPPARRVERHDRRGFREPVSRQHQPSQSFELSGELRLQACAARHEDPQAGAYAPVQAAEQPAAGADVESPAQRARHGEQQGKQAAAREAPVPDARLDGIDEHLV